MAAEQHNSHSDPHCHLPTKTFAHPDSAANSHGHPDADSHCYLPTQTFPYPATDSHSAGNAFTQANPETNPKANAQPETFAKANSPSNHRSNFRNDQTAG